MSHHTTFVGWLNDAYGMERDLVQVLESHAKQAEDYPELAKKITEHLEVTKKHAEMVKSCLESLDEDVSETKGFLGTIMGALKGPTTALADDRLVKNALMESASERFEIASYTALIAAAQEMNHTDVADKLQSILDEEKDMENWLEAKLPTLTKMFMMEKENEEHSEDEDNE